MWRASGRLALGADVVWTEQIDDVLQSDVDVVAELVGGMSPAGEWVERALKAGKSVVTANKQLIAYRGVGAGAAGGGARRAAAAWGGGGGRRAGNSGDAAGLIRRPGDAHQRDSERNLQLHPEPDGGWSRTTPSVLAEAQRLGYAEADPIADVGGFDARAKLCILCRIAMHADVDPETIATQTIGDIDAVDFAYAKELGCTIRQVSRAQLEGDGVYARVAPMLVPLQSPMAWSHGTQNMVVSTGAMGGDVVFSGHGAGGDATAVAVMSDLLAVAQGARSVALPAVKKLVTSDAVAPHYLRFIVDDKPGIVSAISGALSKVGANIDSLLAAARLSQEPAAVRGDDGANAELDHCGGSGVDCGDGLHAGQAARA